MHLLVTALRLRVLAVLVGWLWLVGLGVPSRLSAESLRIESLTRTNEVVLVNYVSETNRYFLLLRVDRLQQSFLPKAAGLGLAGVGTLRDILPPSDQAFYRVLGVPMAQPLDTDQDGIDDVYELQTPGLSALNGADARNLDPQGDGLTYLQRYQQQKAPAAKVLRTSPESGETGVAVTRETVFYFDTPLSTNSTLNTDRLFATFAGRKIIGRTELSSDRRKVTLFYLENLPSSARVRVTLLGTGLKDEQGRDVDGDGDGRPGGATLVDFDTLSTTPVGNTAVTGFVYATEPVADDHGGFTNRPLRGVTVSVDGMEESLRTTTDGTGFFKLQPAPGGRFFVHIDGRTSPESSWPLGAYYPVVGKAWETVAGATNNLAGGNGVVYLPLIPAQALTTVQPNAETRVQFTPEIIAKNPSFAGVEVRVPEGSLYDDNGVRGGRVGIAPVDPKRLPEPLPAGLEFDLVITVQTDGPQNFDRPVPVRFPNSPDPKTGEVLPPGAKDALWSFNHDTGKWEIVGTMTVSSDGSYVESDPGTGILQPGWHGRRRRGRNKTEIWEDQGRNLNEVFVSSFKSGWDGFNTVVGVAELAAGGGPLGPLLSGINFPNDLSNCLGGGTVLSEDCLKVVLLPLQFYPPTALVANVAATALNAYDFSKDTVRMAEAIDSALDAQEACLRVQNGDSGPPPNFTFPPQMTEDRNQAENALNQLKSALPQLQNHYNRLATTMNRSRPTAEKILSNPKNDPLRDVSTVDFQNLLNDLQEIINLRNAINALPNWAQIQSYYTTYYHYYNEYLLHYVQARTLATRFQAFAVSGPDTDGGEEASVVVADRQPRYLGSVFAAGGSSQPLAFSGTRLEANLAPNNLYQAVIYNPQTQVIGIHNFESADVGATREMPPILLVRDSGDDTDRDGVSNLAERVAGTNPNSSDSDGDGIPDGAELSAGTDPNGGAQLVTGVAGRLALTGDAVDVCAVSTSVLLARGVNGIALIGAPLSGDLTILAQVDTPGFANRVSCDQSLVAVADRGAGLIVVDVSDPPAARIRQQVLVGDAFSVVAIDGTAYVGTVAGSVVSVHMASGTVLGSVVAGAQVMDLAVSGGILFAAMPGRLASYRLLPQGELEPLGSVPLNFFAEGITGSRRIGVGAGFVYVSSYPGYDVIDVRDPTSLKPVGDAADVGPNSFKQLLPAGSIGIAAVGTNPRDDGTHDVGIYDLSNPSVTGKQLLEYETPGIARAVTLDRGRVLVADGTSGLVVIRHRPPDSGNIPPTISLRANFPIAPEAVLESGSVAAIIADAIDDVDVREVHFFIDGALVATDGSYPFEHHFTAPTISVSRTSIRIRARAIDTGGNLIDTAEIAVRLAADLTAPRAKPAPPTSSGFGANVLRLTAVFSEEIDPSTLTPNSFQLVEAGPDRIIGTDDDVPVRGEIHFGVSSRQGVFTVPQILSPGRYQAFIDTSVADLAGNHLRSPVSWVFLAISGTDGDGDGLTDAFETASGMNPKNPDENGNGLPDATEDFDGDGLSNGLEMLMGTNPRNQRTFNGQMDRERDQDGDYLPDWREIEVGADLLNPDSDGDGWTDEIEVSSGSNPVVPNRVFPGLYGGLQTASVLRWSGASTGLGDGNVLRLSDNTTWAGLNTANALLHGGANLNGDSVQIAQPLTKVRIGDELLNGGSFLSAKSPAWLVQPPARSSMLEPFQETNSWELDRSNPTQPVRVRIPDPIDEATDQLP